MTDSTLMSWVVAGQPWELEAGLTVRLDLPLNLEGNAVTSPTTNSELSRNRRGVKIRHVFGRIALNYEGTAELGSWVAESLIPSMRTQFAPPADER
jgi:hypothetical protein